MHAAVLLAGPSFASVTALPPCDVSIAANRAALRFPVDVWAAIDLPVVRRDGDAVTARTLLTSRDTLNSLRGHPWASRDVALTDDLRTYCPAALGWTLYTAPAALVYVGYLGATRIDAYGADFGTGATMEEWDGYRAADANYTPERWAREREIWERVTEWLAGRGVEVRRVASI